ncbi:energy transducer TonB [Teredinibacter turnerae]|uniref:energy transducer TonB n=1 Tax=Teredinibacter turnerae TaxID=2426 RepID=UPI0003717BE9
MTMAAVADGGGSDRLIFGMFLASALHAMLILGVDTGAHDGTKLAPTLNITLATHKSNNAPDKADFLAQFNQQASGTADSVKEVTTDKLAEIEDTQVRDVNPLPQRKASTDTPSTAQLLATTRPRDRAVTRHEDTDLKSVSDISEGALVDAPLESTEIASLRAKLDRERQALANKPRTRRLTSASTKASYDAAYLNDWAYKVESVGNANFPAEALQQAIFGSLRVAVLIDRYGKVKRVEILESSGHRLLDDATRQIVRLASPFPALPEEMLEHADQLEIIRTWRFELSGMSTSR